MGIQTATTTILAGSTTRSAATRNTRVDCRGADSINVHARREGAGATILAVHLDAAAKADPDEAVDNDWLLDVVSAEDINADQLVHLMEFGWNEVLPPFMRVRTVHTGIDTEYEVSSSTKGNRSS